MSCARTTNTLGQRHVQQEYAVRQDLLQAIYDRVSKSRHTHPRASTCSPAAGSERVAGVDASSGLDMRGAAEKRPTRCCTVHSLRAHLSARVTCSSSHAPCIGDLMEES